MLNTDLENLVLCLHTTVLYFNGLTLAVYDDFVTEIMDGDLFVMLF